MLSSHLLLVFLSSLALSLQTTSAFMPTSASEHSQHSGHKTHYMQPYEKPRSLNFGDYELSVLPTSSRVSSPTVLRLHPAAGKPTHLHANLPLRFGRTSEAGPSREQHTSSKSSLNLPQRFGRSQGCSRCTRSGTPPSATLPQRFGRRNVLRAVDWLPIRLMAAILGPASSSSEAERRTSFDVNSSEWTEDIAEAEVSQLTDL